MLGEQTIIKDKTKFELSKTIGLISDTHVPKKALAIPRRVFEVFQGVDYIIHAGDLVELAVIEDLEQIAPVLAVHGNMDGLEVANILPKLNSMRIFDWKIGVMHEPNLADGYGKMQEIAQQNGFNVIVYGHTHLASIKWEDKTLYVNPGSPIEPSSPFDKPSVAL